MSKNKVNLGQKQGCPKCSSKFYDFGRQELTCPKCGTTFSSVPQARQNPGTPFTRDFAALEDDVDITGPDAEFESLEELEEDDDQIVHDLGKTAGSDERDSY